MYLRIKELRQKNKLTQTEFARKINTNRGILSQIELGNTKISIELLENIANKFNVSYRWLIEGRSENRKENKDKNIKNTGIIVNGNGNNNNQYTSESPDVLRKEIFLLNEFIKEKDNQLKEKDRQINMLLSILKDKK